MFFSRRALNEGGEITIQSEEGAQRTLRSTSDWSDSTFNEEHLWVPTSLSGDFCYVREPDCSVSLFEKSR